ncbi:UNVERIFIED_CONTAM: hypothetical protein RMT77_003726 [Armadillidium vulgare]
MEMIGRAFLEYLRTYSFAWAFILILICCALYFRYTYSYWKIRGVDGPDPVWLFGNLLPRLRATVSLADFDQNLYKNYKGHKLCGYYEFTKPVLMIGDPQLLKNVMIKDFDHFTDRSFVVFNEPVMDHMLLGLKGSVWKRVRSAMTPTFSSGKIKQTFSLLNDCSENLVKYFHKKINEGCSVFEMKEVYGMFTMDTIASIAFGVNSDSLNNIEDEFFAAAARFFQPVSKWRRPIVFLQFVLPHLARIFGLNGIDKTPVKFFTKVVSDTIKYRLKNGVRRSDFLQLLLDASIQEHTNNNNKIKGDCGSNLCKDEKVLTELVITAQCVLFYIAGYDTTATTLSFVSYCLALHPKIQQKLLEEIDQVLQDCDSNITFEVIQNMTYLDMVFAETLRLYPPAPRVDRRCTKDYVLPEVGLSIHKNTKITIPIYSIHRDPRHYEDPEKFDPERFSQSAKAGRPPMVYLPFGSGPRNCIGWRFALMEAKVALVHILKDFVFIPSKKTQVPIVLERSSGLLKAIDGVWVRIVTRTDS